MGGRGERDSSLRCMRCGDDTPGRQEHGRGPVQGHTRRFARVITSPHFASALASAHAAVLVKELRLHVFRRKLRVFRRLGGGGSDEIMTNAASLPSSLSPRFVATLETRIMVTCFELFSFALLPHHG